MNFLRKIWFLAKKKPLTSKNLLVAIIVYAIGAVVFPIALQVLWLLFAPVWLILCAFLITIPIVILLGFIVDACKWLSAIYCIAGIVIAIIAYNQDKKLPFEEAPELADTTVSEAD